MRECPKCNKANRPERKFCIRCGASLLKPISKTPPKAETPKVEIPPAPVTETPTTPPTAQPATEDEWVKPSEVQRDRVRTAGSGKQKSELDKAREAFARAETVGIEEEGSGVIETRMLRASEVRELLEGPSVADFSEETMPTPTMMEGSEPLPEGAEELMMPTKPMAEEVESRILGSKSVLITPEATEEDVSPLAPSAGDDFASSRYEDMDVPETTEPVFAPAAPSEGAAVQPPPEGLDTVMECPNCGSLVSKDQFSYPEVVYSAMGAARLKQARFLVVQGKNEAAMKELRIARSLFTRAGDSTGLEETSKLVDSLART